MKKLIISTVISILAGILPGCARLCFYQAGKDIEQSKHDLLQCIQEANNSGYGSKKALSSSLDTQTKEKHQPSELICSCMLAKGYQYLNLNKMPNNRKHIMVAAPFQKYWLVDGAGDEVPENHKILSEQKVKENKPDSQVKRLIRYTARKNISGELMKDSSGNYIFDPVYDEGQQVAASTEHNNQK